MSDLSGGCRLPLPPYPAQRVIDDLDISPWCNPSEVIALRSRVTGWLRLIPTGRS